MKIFCALAAFAQAIDDNTATNLIQSELSRCQSYDTYHETCVENIRSAFSQRYNVNVTCAYTSDWMNVGGVTYWFGNVQNYGAVMCGELTYTDVNQSILDNYSSNAYYNCQGQYGQQYNNCVASYLSNNGADYFCAGARSYNVLVSDPAYQYWSGWGAAYSNAGNSYVIAYCIYR
ncbi:unnamed protein product [Oikopleura dioica]|uniref:Uncharacterized protein n=1 Tax=Oikopleura dioica TaxID=34765 RepID=E4X7Y1_OIKDI|nr:unnamed protein product [Oikopleura dioica]CBY33495.1 unnamed protein product [Oikopleura dioica]